MKLSSREISDAVGDLGWRLILGTVRTQVPTGSLAEGADFAARVAAIPGADGHVVLDVRTDCVVVTVGPEDIELAREITAQATASGLEPSAANAAGAAGAANATRPARAAQLLEIAIDAMDILAVRPFWKAVLGYVDEPEGNGLIDPLNQGPAVWFQQMDAPRPQRNRIHLDVSVPHDEAEQRIAATLKAGGTLIGDERAPAFWVLADPEGNEACVCTWQNRDE